MMKAKHNVFLYPFFKWYSEFLIKKHFDQVVMQGNIQDRGLPVLLIANHMSWWDGFWAEHLNLKLFRRKFHFMMKEEQLHRYIFFNHIGGYSVKKTSRSVIKSIDYTTNLLTDPENLVLIFPQGRIQSMHNQTFDFQKGIEKIIEKLDVKKIQMVFLVNKIDFFSKKKPTLYQYYEEYKLDSFICADIQKNFNFFFSEKFRKTN